jgi:CRISPR-associated endonuclease Csn1
VNDIIFYQRPLKSKKSLISNCPYEYHIFYQNGERRINPIKCIAKSNPLFQEFRLWQFIHNLRILEREKQVGEKMEIDIDVTSEFLPTPESYVKLFEYLNEEKEIEQDSLLKKYFNKKKAHGKDEKLPYRWNYVEDKKYPCNETHAQIIARLKRCNIPNSFLTNEKEMELWHILYSVDDKSELIKALHSFKNKYNLTDSFVEEFQKFPSFKKEYGSYSEKAIKKLLSLMRMGKYWDENAIDENTILRIQSISKRLEEINHDAQNIKKVSDDDIPEQVLKSFRDVKNLYSGLNTYQACYAIYGRHSESLDISKWKTPDDIELFLKQFKQHSLHNPIVEQVVTETLRVVKDIWSTYGEISEIHIELGRSMKHTAAERARRTTQNSENENTNLRIKRLLMELQNDSSVENVRPYSPNQQEILKLYEEGALLSADELPDDILKISKMNHPSSSELTRYRLWLEQQYRSPYTGEIIPLSKLFTPAYEIEHVIPQSRYFDDSLSNKVICESEVNKLKGNLLGYEFIKAHEGYNISLSFGKSVRVFSTAEYEDFIRKHYKGNRGKITKLLLDEIPASFIERQLNDTRYISKLIKGLLSNIVREEDEQEATSKNVIPCSGGITAALKKDWGLTDSWNKIIQPRFMRLNALSNSSNFGEWKNNHFQIQIPIELQKGFNKKRIDHRHHALDAVIIACATRNHINYLNNESARESKEKGLDKEGLRHDLKNKLCSKTTTDDKGNYQWRFNKPWDTFTQDVQDSLEKIVVSFKQNLRVINKTVNKYQVYEGGKKIIKSQEKGDSWAIRKPLHKKFIYAKVSLRKIKTVKLNVALNDWRNIVDKKLKKEINRLITKYGKFDIENIDKYFKDRKYIFNKKNISKVNIYYFEEGNMAIRKNLDASFDVKKIKSITDTGIQKILLKHLDANDNKPDIAFSPEGIEEMNQRLIELNNGKPHQPIYIVRKYELSKRFPLGSRGNKKSKYVETADDTNLFYAIYQSNEGERIYETIPLNTVIERQKQGLTSVQENKENKNKSYRLLFWLSPNDLVYVPTEEERENPHLVDLTNPTKEQVKRIYKFVSCTKGEGYFVPNSYASPIKDTEMGTNNKSERMINYADNSVIYDGDKPIQIKSCCWKLTIDRLGNILKYIR